MLLLATPLPPFSLIVVTRIYVYVYTYIFLNITHAVCIMLLVYMFPGLLFPGRTMFPHSQHFFVACSSLCRTEILWCTVPHTPSTLQCLLLSLFGSCLGSHCGETLWVYFWHYSLDTISQRTPWSSGPSNLSTPSSLRCWSCFEDVSTGTGSTSLHFDWLWFSLTVSTCCKEAISLMWCEDYSYLWV